MDDSQGVLQWCAQRIQRALWDVAERFAALLAAIALDSLRSRNEPAGLFYDRLAVVTGHGCLSSKAKLPFDRICEDMRLTQLTLLSCGLLGALTPRGPC
jgi:hypothetical protein